MTDSSSIWLRDLTQSILTNKFHNTSTNDEANDNKPSGVEIEANNDDDGDTRREVSMEMFHNVYEKEHGTWWRSIS